MNATRDCPLTHQVVGWALHSLEPDEEMAVLLHLPQCAVCRDVAKDTEKVLAGMGGIVPLAEPPTGLRNRILAEAASTPQRPAVLRPRQEPSALAGPTVPIPRHRLDAQDARPRRSASRRSARPSRARRLAAAGLAVAAALTVGVLAVRTVQLESERNVETAQAQSLTELVQEIGEPGARYALLSAEAGAPVAAVLLEDEGERRVYPVGLPANSADSTYVAWGLPADGSAPVPLAPFDVVADDQGARSVGSVTGGQDFPTYAVSIEPGRVAPTTPSTVVASGQVTS